MKRNILFNDYAFTYPVSLLWQSIVVIQSHSVALWHSWRFNDYLMTFGKFADSHILFFETKSFLIQSRIGSISENS
jgi:hypothetical protein